MKRASDDVSPSSLLVDELSFLRKSFRETAEAYVTRLDGEIQGLSQAVAEQGRAAKVPAARMRDLRDMLTLVRMLEVKPAKGRRRDLKRFETLVAELRDLVDNW